MRGAWRSSSVDSRRRSPAPSDRSSEATVNGAVAGMLCGLLAFASCATANNSAPPPPTRIEACSAFARARCDRLKSCTPVPFDWEYGSDAAACVKRYEIECQAALCQERPGIGEAIQACATALGARSCDDVVPATMDDLCKVRGDLPAGSACVSNAQCSGEKTGCSGGVCGPTLARQTPRGVNEFCLVGGASSGSLAWSLACVLGAALPDGGRPSARTCVPRAGEGHPCEVALPEDDPCDIALGLTCRATGEHRVGAPGACTARVAVSLGDACSGPCPPGSACVVTPGTPASPGSSSCRRLLEPGESCRPVGIGLCRPPSSCGSGQRCALPATSCP